MQNENTCEKTYIAKSPIKDEKLLINSKGHYVPFSKIDEHDLVMDEFVKRQFRKAKELQESMKKFKSALTSDCESFLDLLFEKYQVQKRSKGGNVTFQSYDGIYRIKLAMQKKNSFWRRIASCKNLD